MPNLIDKLKAQAAAFLNMQTLTLGDELEAMLRSDIEKQPQLLAHLESYDYYPILAANMLEIVVGPIVQLAEVKDLGAAFLFAQRLSRFKEAEGDYLKVFYHQISCLELPDRQAHSLSFSLQRDLARLATIFTYKFPLIGTEGLNLHPNRGSRDLINPDIQQQLRIDLAKYVTNISTLIAQSIQNFAQERGVNLDKLTNECLDRENSTTPDSTWKIEKAERDQVSQDAEMASLQFINELQTIEHAIYTERNPDSLLSWINRGINLINYHKDSFYHCRQELFNQLTRQPSYFPLLVNPQVHSEVHAAFLRYCKLRKVVDSIVKLRRKGIFWEWDILIDLLPHIKEYLYDNEIAFDKEIFDKWTIPMFNNMELLLRIHREWLKKEKTPLKLSFYFSHYSFEELQEIGNHRDYQFHQSLKLLVQTGGHPANLSFLLKNFEFFKALVETSSNEALISFLFHLPSPYFSLVEKKCSPSLNNFLFHLADATKQALFNHNPSPELLKLIDEAATHENKALRQRYQFIFKFPNLLLKPGFTKGPEYQFILKHDWEDLCKIFLLLQKEDPSIQAIKFHLISSPKGIMCNAKKYCLTSEQLKLDKTILPFIQQLLIKLNHGLPESTLNALCSPWFIEAYSKGTLKVEHLENCTPQEIERITEQTLGNYLRKDPNAFTRVGNSKKDSAVGRNQFFYCTESLVTSNPYQELSSERSGPP